MKKPIFCMLAVCLSTIFSGGCSTKGLEKANWDLVLFPRTGIDPEVGTYSTSYGGTFRVFIDSESRAKMIGFGEHAEPIIRGEFQIYWGDVTGQLFTVDPSNPNFHCPDDGFAASGHFLTSTNAEGQYREAQNCTLTLSVDFSAAKTSN